jgi:rhomboid family GlyGly-CTERM serine protease
MKLFSKNDNHPAKVQIPWLTAILYIATLALFLMYGEASTSLIYDRTAIAQGEIWRLLTGHFVHCDQAHLLWNLLPLALISGLLEQRVSWRRVSAVTLVSCLGVSGWLWFARPQLLLYCGLSGMLNGLLVVLLAMLWQENRHPVLPLIGLVAVLKIIFETTTQEAIFTHLSWAGFPEAHGAGLVSGVLFLGITSLHSLLGMTHAEM